jgi:hypothetical protein
MKKRHGVFFGFAVLLIAAIFTSTGCDTSGGDDDTFEFNEEDFIVTDQIISETANEAMINFFAIPDIKPLEENIANAKADGFIYLTNNGLAVIEGSSSKFITGKTNQLTPIEGSLGTGFTFSLNTKALDSDAFRPGMGFGAMGYLTKDNLGQSTYDSFVGELEKLTPREGGWIVPSAAILADLGIGVFTTHSGSPLNITNRISFAFSLAEKNGGKLMIYYGAIMVDRAITNFYDEGVFLNVTDGEEWVWSDGTKDGKITAEWWIAKQP